MEMVEIKGDTVGDDPPTIFSDLHYPQYPLIPLSANYSMNRFKIIARSILWFIPRSKPTGIERSKM
jgi:hypothetical protein